MTTANIIQLIKKEDGVRRIVMGSIWGKWFQKQLLLKN